jgi:predicted phosphodiesterase
MARLNLVTTGDTHVPKRARDLPDEVWHAVDAADVVIHTGDWVDPERRATCVEMTVVAAVTPHNDHYRHLEQRGRRRYR